MIEYIGNNKAKLVVSVGSRDNRKRYTKTITYKRKKDVAEAYREFEQKIKGGIECSLYVEELIDWYIDECRKYGQNETTISKAYETAKKPLIAFFKGYKASEVSSYHIGRFVSAELKKRAPKTIKNEVSLLSACYNKAVALNMLKNNPCDGVALPKVKKPDIDVLNSDDYKQYIKAISEHDCLDFKVSLELALFCGLRCSEICALTPDDCNTTFKTVDVNKSRHRIKVDGHYQDVIKDPKTASSYRVVAIPQTLADDIFNLISLHNSRPYGCEYLIQNQFGEAVTHNWFQRHLAKFIADNNLAHTTMHALRHTHASMLINNGFEVAEVSRQLGHSSVNTTMAVYTHAFERASTASRRIAEVFENETLMGHSEEKEKAQTR